MVPATYSQCMTYSVPLGPGAANRADYTASPAEGDSPFASPYATDSADNADVAQADPAATDDHVERPHDGHGVEDGRYSGGYFDRAPGEGQYTDHVDDLGDADESHYNPDGSFHAGYDSNGDGRIDRTLDDEDGDGRIDVYSYDRDGDGRVDLELRDTNHDGRIDHAEIDSNFDGHVNSTFDDSDYDGHYDVLRYDPHG